jgi:hypothetical protein
MVKASQNTSQQPEREQVTVQLDPNQHPPLTPSGLGLEDRGLEGSVERAGSEAVPVIASPPEGIPLNRDTPFASAVDRAQALDSQIARAAPTPRIWTVLPEGIVSAVEPQGLFLPGTDSPPVQFQEQPSEEVAGSTVCCKVSRVNQFIVLPGITDGVSQDAAYAAWGDDAGLTKWWHNQQKEFKKVNSGTKGLHALHIVKVEGDHLEKCEYAQFVLFADLKDRTRTATKHAPLTTHKSGTFGTPFKSSPTKPPKLDWGWDVATKPKRDQMFFPTTSGDYVSWEYEVHFLIQVRLKPAGAVVFNKYWYIYITSDKDNVQSNWAIWSDAGNIDGLGFDPGRYNPRRLARQFKTSGNKSIARHSRSQTPLPVTLSFRRAPLTHNRTLRPGRSVA